LLDGLDLQVSDKLFFKGRNFGKLGDTNKEVDLHEELSAEDSDHIVRFLASDFIVKNDDQYARAKDADPDFDEAVMDPLLLGNHTRIVMEYCELGSLYQLIKVRQRL
jgi:hypothetical protein